MFSRLVKLLRCFTPLGLLIVILFFIIVFSCMGLMLRDIINFLIL